MKKIAAITKEHPNLSACVFVILFLCATFEFIITTLALEHGSKSHLVFMLLLMLLLMLLQFLISKLIERNYGGHLFVLLALVTICYFLDIGL